MVNKKQFLKECEEKRNKYAKWILAMSEEQFVKFLMINHFPNKLFGGKSNSR